MNWASAEAFVTLIQRTHIVVAETPVLASHSPAIQPSRKSYVKVTIADGTTGSGTVTAAGNVDGSPDTEVLTFTENGVKRGEKAFESWTGFTTSGLADEASPPTIKIEAVDNGGSPQHTEATIATGLPATIKEKPLDGGDFAARRQGTSRERERIIWVPYSETYTPAEAWLVLDEKRTEYWYVKRAEVIERRHIPLHWELRCSRHQSR